MNNNRFERELLEYGSAMKRGYAYIIANSGKIIAGITAAVAVLLAFTDITFAAFGTAEFTSSLIMMLISSYLIYFSLEDAGEKLGEESEEYRSAAKRYEEARARITPQMIDPLRRFCTEYSVCEAEFRRESLILSAGESVADFEAFAKCESGGSVSKAAKRVFRRAMRIKPISITPQILISGNKKIKSEIISPERTKLLSLLGKLLPSTLCMLFTASIVLTAKESLNVQSVIESIVKLSALPIVAFRGYSEGYFYAKSGGVLWLETKARLLESFLMKEKAKCEVTEKEN